MPAVAHLLNTPLEEFPYRLLAASTNGHGRVISAILKHQKKKYYLTRKYRTNGACYFHIEPV
jgi:hypothetical protein